MVILGIDEAYQYTGTAIVEDNVLIKSKSWNLKKFSDNTSRRNEMRRIVKGLIKKYKCDIIIVERIRTFSQGFVQKKGFMQKNSFMSKNYIMATAALVTCIVDTAYEYGIPVFSVDTRSWKSQIVGTSKHKKGESTKKPTLDFIKQQGYIVQDDNEADAICIALYGFIPKTKQKLQREK